MSAIAAAAPRALPPVAAAVDEALVALDRDIDWLLALTPVANDALWAGFEASGFAGMPPLRYIDLEVDLDEARDRLDALPVDAIESPLLAGVLSEKQRELERHLQLVRLRGTEGFRSASLDLFGGVEAGLLTLARRILAEVPPGTPLQADAGIDEVVEAVTITSPY